MQRGNLCLEKDKTMFIKWITVNKGRIIIGLAALLVAFGSGIGTVRLLSGMAAHIVSPFTIKTLKTSYKKGIVVHTEIESKAFRSDGSTALFRENVNGKSVNIRNVDDRSTGKHTFIDEVTQTTTTYNIANRSSNNAKKSCSSGDSKELFGFQVYKTTLRFGTGNRLSNIEEWLAPVLDCSALESHIDLLDSTNQLIQHDDVTAIAVIQGEPDQKLFEIPVGYMERSPSQWEDALAQVTGKKCEQCKNSAASNKDKIYYARQQ